MGSFDFLFMPSNHEGLVLTSIEASLAHTPAVVNWCPGVNESLSKEWPRGGKRAGYPILGDNVVVCCGAKIIGNVRIGNNVIIGANAVVVTDIPDYAVVGGVPAKVIGKNGKVHVKQ